MANNFFSPESNFTKLVNRYVIILGGRFYSPSSRDVAWLERAQLIRWGGVGKTTLPTNV